MAESNKGQIDSTMSEAYLIGAILNDEGLIDEFVSVIEPGMFQSSVLSQVWQAAVDLSSTSQPVTIPSLAAVKPELVERVSVDRLITYQQAYIGRTDAKWHVQKIVEMNMRRRIMHAAKELAYKATDVSGTSVEELLGAFEQVALSVETEAQTGLVASTLDAVEWFEKLEERHKNPDASYGMKTGWIDVDAITLGWQRKDLIIIGGRTSVGKTAFAMENLIRLNAAGYKVAMFSLEMSREQVQNRLAGNMADVRLGEIRTGRMDKNDLLRVGDMRTIIAQIAIDDTSGVTTEYITAEMKRWKRRNGLDFVVVDYLQEIDEKQQANDNTGSALARVARKLRRAAKDCDCAVMALSQLTREAEGKEPRISDLFGSSGIESAADVIALLHRDKEESPRMLELNIAKQRNGAVGKANFNYDLAKQRIIGINDTRYVEAK